MTIELYPVKIEAYEDGEPMFKLEAFDEHCATLTVDTLVSHGNIDELFAAIKDGLKLMRLSKCESDGEAEEE
jgi:hypothetical protein